MPNIDSSLGYELLIVTLFFLPAFIANALPVIIQNIPRISNWKTPLWEKRLGKNKTYRGLVFGVLGGTLSGIILFQINAWGDFWTFSLGEFLFIGFLLGLGALLGDAVESAFKRIIGIAPGKALPFFDGADYIIGASVLVMPFYIVSWYEFLFLLLLGPILSLLSNTIAYFLGWKKVWY